MKKKFAVVLAGNGVFDGAEIHEATLTLYSIMKIGAEYCIFAPDIEQYHVINHITGEEMPEKRNVLVESARIARGKIKPLKEFDENNFDAIIFPGGFGVAKNLSTFAFEGANCSVNVEVEKAVLAMWKLKKPIGALCIAPAVIAKIIKGAIVTIGQDRDTIREIIALGGKHTITNHGEIIIDEQNKIMTSPCYMLDADILQIAEGVDNLVKAIIEQI